MEIQKFCSDIRFQEESDGRFFFNRWLSCIFSPIKRDNFTRIREELVKIQIESRSLWYPLHLQPVFKWAHCYQKRETQIVGNSISRWSLSIIWYGHHSHKGIFIFEEMIDQSYYNPFSIEEVSFLLRRKVIPMDWNTMVENKLKDKVIWLPVQMDLSGGISSRRSYLIVLQELLHWIIKKKYFLI
ncbi:MAG: hypothetical protein ACMUEM_05210 [Flavobacteriales bacterium AspAUS03]